jgi:hypothetical protein
MLAMSDDYSFLTQGAAIPAYLDRLISTPLVPLENPLVTHAQSNLASEFYDRLVKWIETFDKGLDIEHEVGVRLVSFGQTVVFSLASMSYWNPSLISFSGQTEEGDPVELIQHVSQISVLLTRLKRKDPREPKQPIGFTV